MSDQAYDPNNPHPGVAPQAAGVVPGEAPAVGQPYQMDPNAQMDPTAMNPGQAAPHVMAPPLSPGEPGEAMGSPLDPDHAYATATATDAALYATATGQESWDESAGRSPSHNQTKPGEAK